MTLSVVPWLKPSNTNIVVWVVQHPTPPNNLVLHHENRVRYVLSSDLCMPTPVHTGHPPSQKTLEIHTYQVHIFST